MSRSMVKLIHADDFFPEHEVWGFKNLHALRPSISYNSLEPSEVLDEELLSFFSVYDNLLLKNAGV